MSDNYSRFYTLITIVKLITMGTSLLSSPAVHIVNNSAQIISTKNRLQPTLMSSEPTAKNKKAQWSSDFFFVRVACYKNTELPEPQSQAVTQRELSGSGEARGAKLAIRKLIVTGLMLMRAL